MAKGKKTGGRNFKPHQSGNPSGRAPDSPMDKIVKKMTKETFSNLAQLMMSKDKDGLEDVIAAKVPFEVELFIRHMLSLGENPDWAKYEKYLERRIGKVKDEVDVVVKPFVINRPGGGTTILGTTTGEDE